MTALSLRAAVRQLIDQFGAELSDPLPAGVRTRHELMPLAAALTEAHWPSEFEQRDAALRRLAFDELLAVQLSLVRRRRRRAKGAAPTIKVLSATAQRLKRRFVADFDARRLHANAAMDIGSVSGD